ncbi:DUF4097 family beta strand repeat-containing protein [Streptococcus suis]|uniref:DUF4097 family beta strand repeat-containing protein n=1 Tax=Streptococcus suis TaxID=1307 RepID=UPI00022F96E1|nr:DUF4097 family beta strand repeat-containing protein [Streptococcus suis]AER21202.1 hypothetical protein SSUST1_0822 [Streptococcus suis ST1]MBS7944853.1 DUF4097 domain-containing protein [Streptococcus suis]MDW8592631.1 DUF4097 family beta strand repeat-containing protein [Streptococcus suis]MDW8622266.1 DUF4097 family beta strand repeat-containing protein [Streptococcus suis]MDX5014234.1 DUF4097 family beta strand repeat-containing protein [Streptococcus suis]
MKQLKPFAKISLSLLTFGTILSLICYLAGGWTNMKTVAENYFQPQTASFSNIRAIEVNEKLSIMPSPDNQFHLHYYRNQHKGIDLLSHQVQDGKLTISSAYQGIVTYDGLLEPILNLVNDQNVAYYQPVLQVPKNSTIETLSGNLQGDIYLDKVTIQNLELTAEDGDMLIENSQLSFAHLSHLNGEVAINHSTLISPKDISDTVGSSLTIEDGDFKAENLKLEGRHSISNYDGSIDISLHSKTKTDIHIDASQNNLRIELPNYINPKATNYLDISTLDGELNIR